MAKKRSTSRKTTSRKTTKKPTKKTVKKTAKRSVKKVAKKKAAKTVKKSANKTKKKTVAKKVGKKAKTTKAKKSAKKKKVKTQSKKQTKKKSVKKKAAKKKKPAKKPKKQPAKKKQKKKLPVKKKKPAKKKPVKKQKKPAKKPSPKKRSKPPRKNTDEEIAQGILTTGESQTTHKLAAPKKVFVTGATGFVGRAVVDELLHHDYDVVALVRKGSTLPFSHERLVGKEGDVLNYDSLLSAMAECDAVIHLVGIIEENKKKEITFQRLHVDATRKVTDAAKELGIKRLLHMSALGTRPNAKSKYHKTKFEAEEIVRNSGLNYTIFRPSMIFGPKDKSINLFVSILKQQPGVAVFPILGKGKLQPISVEDVARGFVSSLTKPESIQETYNVGGPHAYTLRELISTIGKVLKKPVITPSVPYAFSRTMVALSGPLAPLNADQLKMLQEDNTCDHELFAKTFHLRLREFLPRLKEYLR